MHAMKPYDGFFLFPPRPTRAVLPPQFNYFERRGWVCQQKLNGTNAVIALGPNGEQQLWNRHNEPLNWAMPPATEGTLRRMIDHPGWTVLVAELLRNKVSNGPKDVIFCHDVLVWRGEYLVGSSYKERYAILMKQCAAVGFQAVKPGWLEVTDKVWLAANIAPNIEAVGGFEKLFETLKPQDIVEGVVLKNGSARLELCDKESANNLWSVKCRLASKNWSH